MTLESLEPRLTFSAEGLDPSLGLGGQILDQLAVEDAAGGVALQPDGELVFAGTGAGYQDPAVARYSPDGQVDDRLDQEGTGNSHFSGTDDGGERIVSPWHNSNLPCDVNDDGAVDANDATVLLGFLNTYGTQSMPSPAVEDAFLAGDAFFDVDGDGTVQPLDLLRVINALNDGSRAGEAAEQEGLPGHNPVFPSDVDSGGAMGDTDAAGLLAYLETYGTGPAPLPAAAPHDIAARTAALLDESGVVPSLDPLGLIVARERQDDSSAQGSEGEKLPGDTDGLADLTEDGAFGRVAPLAGIWR